jgi:hypothetical protein
VVNGNRICIILDSEFGSRLRGVDKSGPIWIVQSLANDPVIADLWKSKTGNVTSFRAQEFGTLIETVDQHHPDWRELEVHGFDPENAAVVLVEFGGVFASTVGGFLFERSSQASSSSPGLSG